MAVNGEVIHRAFYDAIFFETPGPEGDVLSTSVNTIHTATYRLPPMPRGAETRNDQNALDETVRQYDLLRLVRDVGHRIGLSSGDIQHMDYLISHTRDVDWQAGGRPVVYKSVCKMARERGVSERQIHNRETRLHGLGCLVWNDMGNFRRTGARDRAGRIAFAYGVDLSPLASRYDEFAALKEKQTEDLAAFDTARRKVSAIRRRVLVKITMAQEADLDVGEIVERVADLPRVHARTSPGTLEAIVATITGLETELDEALANSPDIHGLSSHCMGSPDCGLNCGLNTNTSDQPEENFRHIQPTNNPQFSKENTCNPPVASRPIAWACQPVIDDREEIGKKPDGTATGSGCASGQGDKQLDGRATHDEMPPMGPGGHSPAGETPPSTGAKHVDIRQALQAASDDFNDSVLPTGRRLGWADVVDAAALRCHGLGIHRSAWADACSVMGRNGAAVAVIIIDRNLDHPDCPVIKPGGVLRSLTNRARIGELHLHKSIYGILARDNGDDGNGGLS